MKTFSFSDRWMRPSALRVTVAGVGVQDATDRRVGQRRESSDDPRVRGMGSPRRSRDQRPAPDKYGASRTREIRVYGRQRDAIDADLIAQIVIMLGHALAADMDGEDRLGADIIVGGRTRFLELDEEGTTR